MEFIYFLLFKIKFLIRIFESNDIEFGYPTVRFVKKGHICKARETRRFATLFATNSTPQEL